jgi:signal recognition particle receptor subunit beta
MQQQIMRIVVMGLPGSGKSTFIQTISEEVNRQKQAFSSWLFGKVTVDDSLMIHFAEPPSKRVTDFMWMRELIATMRASAYIVVLDSTRPQSFGKFISILYSIRGFDETLPVVVAANKQDNDGAWSAQDIRYGLRIGDDIPVIPCAAMTRPTVEDVVIALLQQMSEPTTEPR